MNRFLYSLLLYLITPLVIGRLFWRSQNAPAYGQRVMERFGWIQLPRSEKPLIWVHSVSVGETIASAPLVRELKNQYPSHRILVTTMTPTGSEQVRKLHGASVEHVYACYDLPGAVRRFLTRARPVLAVVIDTELWPNTIAACHNRNISVMVANARLSDRSARGYARFGNLSRRMLEKISMVAAQSQETASRFLELGIPEPQVNVTGSIKFDLQVNADTLLQGKTLRSQWQNSMGSDIRILAAGSTHEGEDQPVIDAFKAITRVHPEVRLLLVPRHPERFNNVFQLIKDNALSVARHSE
ncbi:MAG: 3-deoxy-D-manno-octulosonic acid transferase, partial [Endozoicomonas sp.]